MERRFEEYDRDKLQKAHKIIREVCWYYYSAPGHAKKVKRLETILRKLDELLTKEQTYEEVNPWQR